MHSTTGMKKRKRPGRSRFVPRQKGITVCVVSSGERDIRHWPPSSSNETGKSEATFEVEILPGIVGLSQKSPPALWEAPSATTFCIISPLLHHDPGGTKSNAASRLRLRRFRNGRLQTPEQGTLWQLTASMNSFFNHPQPDQPRRVHPSGGREEPSDKNHPPSADFDPATWTCSPSSSSATPVIQVEQPHRTPRGYYREQTAGARESVRDHDAAASAQCIELGTKTSPFGTQVGAPACIHTTATSTWKHPIHRQRRGRNPTPPLIDGQVRTIVSDVTRLHRLSQGGLERLGIEVKCYLVDPRLDEMASSQSITSLQEGIVLPWKEHRAIYVFGNDPRHSWNTLHAHTSGPNPPPPPLAKVIGATSGFVKTCVNP